MKAITCRNVTKSFEVVEKAKNHNGSSWIGHLRDAYRKQRTSRHAVDGVCLEVERGEIFGVLGRNGSGKSTLVRMLSTLLLPDAGELHVLGLNVVAQAGEVRRRISRVSVDAAFFKKLSAWENLSYTARLYGLDVREAKKKAAAILEGMSFEASRMTQSLEQLSRGMQQKVAVARALLTEPELLLLDEPTTGLDPVSKRQVADYLLRLRRDQGITILLTTHDMDEADKLCDRIAILDEGKIVATDSPQELKRIHGRNGDATLEEVFVKLTGKDWKESEI